MFKSKIVKNPIYNIFSPMIITKGGSRREIKSFCRSAYRDLISPLPVRDFIAYRICLKKK